MFGPGRIPYRMMEEFRYHIERLMSERSIRVGYSLAEVCDVWELPPDRVVDLCGGNLLECWLGPALTSEQWADVALRYGSVEELIQKRPVQREADFQLTRDFDFRKWAVDKHLDAWCDLVQVWQPGLAPEVGLEPHDWEACSTYGRGIIYRCCNCGAIIYEGMETGRYRPGREEGPGLLVRGVDICIFHYWEERELELRRAT